MKCLLKTSYQFWVSQQEASETSLEEIKLKWIKMGTQLWFSNNLLKSPNQQDFSN